MLQVSAVPALKDNYIWWLRRNDSADVVVVDPGEAKPVLERLASENLRLAAIMITHHHWDHTSGIGELLEHAEVPVFGPVGENFPITGLTDPLDDGDRVTVPGIEAEFEVMGIPGHTLGHIAYFGEGVVFSGDTLFSAGCGRLFEGSPEQMHQSLTRLGELPPETTLYCGHEYTLDNLAFAEAVEPENTAIDQWRETARSRIEKGQPSLPSTIGVERDINPFLRCQAPDVVAAAQRQSGQSPAPGAETLAVIREWKDNFQAPA